MRQPVDVCSVSLEGPCSPCTVVGPEVEGRRRRNNGNYKAQHGSGQSWPARTVSYCWSGGKRASKTGISQSCARRTAPRAQIHYSAAACGESCRCSVQAAAPGQLCNCLSSRVAAVVVLDARSTPRHFQQRHAPQQQPHVLKGTGAVGWMGRSLAAQRRAGLGVRTRSLASVGPHRRIT